MLQEEIPNRTRKILWLLVPVTAVLSSFASLTYLIFRVYCLVTTTAYKGSPLVLAWCFLGIELIQILPALSTYLTRACILSKPDSLKLYLQGDDVPTIDVLITTCREDPTVILNSARAACESYWPKDKLRIIVTDDGRDEALASQIAVFQKIYPQLHYTSRPKPERPDFKAGNLNHAISLSATLPGGASDLIAGLDADMIVQPHWLRTMVPHLLKDSNIAMVCSHQHFYNLPPTDPLTQSLAHFSATTELVHRGLDAADCTGTGYVAHRTALASINNFPTFSIAEDTACSTLLLGQGYSITYVDEKLQCGLMPSTFVGHVRQRTRWTIGTIQTAFKLTFRIGSARLAGCTWRQRLVGITTGVSLLLTAAVGVAGFVGLPLALLSGVPFVIFDNAWQLKWLVRTVGVAVFADWAHRGAFALEIGYGFAMRWDQAEAWLVPYFFVSFVRGFLLPSWLGGRHPGFSSSGSRSSAMQERRPHTPPLHRRLYAFFREQMLWFHTLFLFAVLLGVILNIARCFNNVVLTRTVLASTLRMFGTHTKWIFLLTRVGWPPLYWVLQSASCCIPIRYVLWPPREVTMDDALEELEKTGVRYPRDEPETRQSTSYHLTTMVMLYTVICFAGSWFIKDVAPVG